MKTFNYKEKFAFSLFYPAIAFMVIAGLCVWFKFGIAIGNLRILAYPNSAIIMGVIALIFIVSALLKLNKANKSKKNPHKLEVTDTHLSFPKGESEKVTIEFSDVTAIEGDHDEDDGHSLILVTENERFTFKEDNFDSEALYREFAAMVNSKIDKDKTE